MSSGLNVTQQLVRSNLPNAFSAERMTSTPPHGKYSTFDVPQGSQNNIETAFQKQLNLNAYYKSVPASLHELFPSTLAYGNEPSKKPPPTPQVGEPSTGGFTGHAPVVPIIDATPSTGPAAGPVPGPVSGPSAAPGPEVGPPEPVVPPQPVIPDEPHYVPSVGPSMGPAMGPAMGPSSVPIPGVVPGPQGAPGPAPGPTFDPSAGASFDPAMGPAMGPSMGPAADPIVDPMAFGPGVVPGPSAGPSMGPAMGPAMGPSDEQLVGKSTFGDKEDAKKMAEKVGIALSVVLAAVVGYYFIIRRRGMRVGV